MAMGSLSGDRVDRIENTGEDMTEKEKEYVLAKIENEGFDYTFIHYSNFKDIKDKKFHELRLAYKKAAEELSEYVGVEE
jgi:hypothetical protein